MFTKNSEKSERLFERETRDSILKKEDLMLHQK